MYSSSSSLLFHYLFIFLFASSWVASHTHDHHYQDFLQCLHSQQIFTSKSTTPEPIYTPNNPLYFYVLNSSIQNPRFSYPTIPKPLAIVTPFHASQVQATVECSKRFGIQIRTLSGGHDTEGFSSVSYVPFVVVDMRNLSSITINVDSKSAWVEAGATIGQLYYKIAEKSGNLGFPAGICPTVGVGGHFSGGGYGTLMRKYGLAADNIIDAHLVDVEGRILDRESMGEDLFWAIRGGGAASFGIVLAWKIKLVLVPSKVILFNVTRNLERNSTKKLVFQWQYIANKLDEDLLIFVRLLSMNSTKERNNKTIIVASFLSMFLGGSNRLLSLMEKSFPELGLAREDCIETTWIESFLFFNAFPIGAPLEVLLDRTPQPSYFLPTKIKSDYVKEPIPENVLEGMWEMLHEEEVGMANIQLNPYGAKMKAIPKTEIPFPHRAGILYHISYMVTWDKEENEAAYERHINWTRKIYKYMTPYVSKDPRRAYLNYRDIDLGKNRQNWAATSYEEESVWGTKYYDKNFNKLVHVKTRVDPTNFFSYEQSIPPLSPW